MLTSSAMELLSVLVFKEKIEEVVSHLVQLGIFQPVDIRHIEKELDGLTTLEIETENAQWQAIEIQLRDILRKLNLNISPGQSTEAHSSEKIKELFANLEEKLNTLVAQKEELQGELKTKESMLSQVKDYFLFPIKRGQPYTFLEVNLGKLDEKNIVLLERSLKDIPYLIYPFRKEASKNTILLIGLRRDRAFFDKVLSDLAWEKVEFPQTQENLSKDVEEKLKIQIDECRSKINNINGAIEKLSEHYRPELSKIQSFVFLKKTLIEAKKYSCTTDRLVLLSGWIPQEEKERVISEVKKIAKNSYIERKSPRELDIPKEDIPVKMKHSPFFKPFELLVSTYGVPRYGTIDPTIFVAISFLLMFGAMFGDLGHGLIFVLAGLLLRKSKKANVRQAVTLLLYCGLSSSFFGLLYGSVFGLEEIIPTLWIKPMRDIFGIFKISVIFGIAIITVGIVINIINALRDRDYLKALFDKAGLIAGVIYWMVIGYVSKQFASKTKIPFFYIVLISAGFILLFFKPFIEIIFRKGKQKEGIFVSLMESAVDILEIIMGYLANTVSFIRVAAFSLAHGGLFFAIFELSRVLKNVGGGSLSILVIVLGNILIILLEGLVVGIQSLRLNYYEFFSKFFMAGKQFYKPLTTDNR